MASKKRIMLTDFQSMMICKHHDENPDKSIKQLAEWAKIKFDLEKEPSVSAIRQRIEWHNYYKTVFPLFERRWN